MKRQVSTILLAWTMVSAWSFHAHAMQPAKQPGIRTLGVLDLGRIFAFSLPSVGSIWTMIDFSWNGHPESSEFDQILFSDDAPNTDFLFPTSPASTQALLDMPRNRIEDEVEKERIRIMDGEIYVRKTVKAQCTRFRKILDPDFRRINGRDLDSRLEILYYRHNAELLEILKDGVMIVRDSIASSKEDAQRRKHYLRKLQDFWIFAKKVHYNKRMSNHGLVVLNDLLASLVVEFKKEVHHFLDQEDYDLAYDQKFEIVRVSYKTFIKPLEDIELLTAPETDAPTLIIYAHPDPTLSNRGVSISTFVDEFLSGDFPIHIAVFDFHAECPTRRSKRDPHFSYFCGTGFTLRHDFAHILECRFPDDLFQGLKLAYAALQKVRAQEKTPAQLHSIQVLVQGIFTLFHEFSALEKHSERALYDHMGPKHALAREIRFFLRYMEEELEDDRSDPIYKINARDVEDILNCKDENGEPFLKKISIGPDKKRALPIVKAFGQCLIVKSLKDVEEGDEWVLHNCDAPEDVQKMRHKMLSRELLAAYKQFWIRFMDLVITNTPSN